MLDETNVNPEEEHVELPLEPIIDETEIEEGALKISRKIKKRRGQLS